MKYITLFWLLFCCQQLAYAEKIIPCNGTYEASQKWLASLGYTIQGKKDLKPTEVKVLECGNTLEISQHGKTISLKRTTANSNTFKGEIKGLPTINLNLEAVSAQHMKGLMIASDGELTLKRPVAMILESGTTPNIESCEVRSPARPMHTNTLALAIVLTQDGIFPSKGRSYQDYIHEGKSNPTYVERHEGSKTYDLHDSHSVSFYIDDKGAILPKMSDQRLLKGVCSPKEKRLALADKLINIKIIQYGRQIDVFLQINNMNGKITKQYTGIMNGEGVRRISQTIKKAWIKANIPIKSMSDGTVSQ